MCLQTLNINRIAINKFIVLLSTFGTEPAMSIFFMIIAHTKIFFLKNWQFNIIQQYIYLTAPVFSQCKEIARNLIAHALGFGTASTPF